MPLFENHLLRHPAGLARVCHARGAVLLVDEAHGAHLGLHPSFPRSALHQGADVAIQSTHKVLSALTQAAMLHVKGGRIDHTRVGLALQLLQSSSPSYLLLR
jgi:arginine decarboxylase